MTPKRLMDHLRQGAAEALSVRDETTSDSTVYKKT